MFQARRKQKKYLSISIAFSMLALLVLTLMLNYHYWAKIVIQNEKQTYLVQFFLLHTVL